MEKEEPKLLYTTTKDNIKYPVFCNKELDENLQSIEDVNAESLEKSFSLFVNILDQFIALYYDPLKNNLHNLLVLFRDNKKNAASYFLLAKGLKVLCLQIQSQIEAQMNKSKDKKPIEEEEGSIEQLIKDFNKEDNLGVMLKQYYQTENEVRDLLKTFIDYEIQIANSKTKCGLVIIDTVLKYCSIVLKETIERLKVFINIKEFTSTNYSRKEQRNNEIILFNLIFKLEKIPLMGLCFYSAILIDENDIINKSESSKEWKDLKRILIRVVPTKEDEIREANVKMSQSLDFLAVILNDGFNSTSSFINAIKLSGIGIHYLIRKEDSAYDALKLSINPDPNFQYLLTNVLNKGFMKSIVSRSYPKIEFRKKLYLKRIVKEINTEYIDKMNSYINEKSNDFASDFTAYKNNQLLIHSDKPLDLFVEKIAKEDKRYYVSTRLIHSSKIKFLKEPSSLFEFCITPKPNATKDTLLIHIHGGGFIGSSTNAHECYLRLWANRLEIPIIGIDYSLSPQSQYPKALDDIWQAYNWLLKHAEEEFNIKLSRIILSGDSAGGTLALALTFVIIMHQARVPDLLMLEYPCCNTNINNMTNSMVLCIEDKILSFPFMAYMLKSYRPNWTNDDDPFLNPVKANESILMQLPKTRFLFGSSDPLRDDSIRLLYKISKTNADCIGYEFKSHVHGFFGLSSDVIKETPMEVFYREVEQLLKEPIKEL